MRPLFAVLPLVAALFAAKDEAFLFDQPRSLVLDNDDSPVRSHLQMDHGNDEERVQLEGMYEKLNALMVGLGKTGIQVPSSVRDWVHLDRATQGLPTENKQILIKYAASEPHSNDWGSVRRFIVGLDENAVASTINSLKDNTDTSIQAIAASMQSKLMQWWGYHGRSADDVFKLLELDEGALKAKEQTTLEKKVACLFGDPKFETWTAYVEHINKIDPEITKVETLTRFYGAEELTTILNAETMIEGWKHPARKLNNVLKNNWLMIRVDSK